MKDEKPILDDAPDAIAPATLSEESSRMFKRYCQSWDFDDHALNILAAACEAFDRMREAQRIIAAEGICITDRFGQKKQHPATLVERDSRAAYLRALKDLHLDVEPLNDGPGRPAGS
jgi:P27 family predicted phage terminase small subunit